MVSFHGNAAYSFCLLRSLWKILPVCLPIRLMIFSLTALLQSEAYILISLLCFITALFLSLLHFGRAYHAVSQLSYLWATVYLFALKNIRSNVISLRSAHLEDICLF
jgi:hypothetical protein